MEKVTNKICEEIKIGNNIKKQYRVKNNKVNEKDTSSKHLYPPFNINKATKIIIGTIPSSEFCKNEECNHDEHWYYGSKKNKFWELVNDNLACATVKSKKDFMCHNKIGIFDMIVECCRENNSASDSKLYNITLINIKEIIEQNQSETLKIFFTSSFVATLFNFCLNIDGEKARVNVINRAKQDNRIYEKNVEFNILYSPSPQALRGMTKLENPEQTRKEQYKKISE